MSNKSNFETKYTSSVDVASDLIHLFSQRGGSNTVVDKAWMRSMIETFFLSLFGNTKNVRRVLSRLVLAYEVDEDFVEECNKWLMVLTDMETDYASL